MRYYRHTSGEKWWMVVPSGKKVVTKPETSQSIKVTLVKEGAALCLWANITIQLTQKAV
ncbi:MAG TPA: hypothetical protein IAC41_11155 [Candidatus Merdenecus merdavium]|nr:hypothetical protein [Candidatus Merdenecus merdavium]